MANLPKIEIHMTAPGRAVITIDGQRLNGVREISVQIPLRDVPSVTVELVATDISITGEAELALDIVNPLAEAESLERIVEHVLRRLSAGTQP